MSDSRNEITDGLGVSDGQAITLRGNEILDRLAEKMGLSSTPADTDFNERFWRTLQANVKATSDFPFEESKFSESIEKLEICLKGDVWIFAFGTANDDDAIAGRIVSQRPIRFHSASLHNLHNALIELGGNRHAGETFVMSDQFLTIFAIHGGIMNSYRLW